MVLLYPVSDSGRHLLTPPCRIDILIPKTGQGLFRVPVRIQSSFSIQRSPSSDYQFFFVLIDSPMCTLQYIHTREAVSANQRFISVVPRILTLYT